MACWPQCLSSRHPHGNIIDLVHDGNDFGETMKKNAARNTSYSEYIRGVNASLITMKSCWFDNTLFRIPQPKRKVTSCYSRHDYFPFGISEATACLLCIKLATGSIVYYQTRLPYWFRRLRQRKKPVETKHPEKTIDHTATLLHECIWTCMRSAPDHTTLLYIPA